MSIVAGSLLLAAPVAVAAGAVSFASPCVLPLVPGYLSYVTGMTGADVAEDGGAPTRRSRVASGALRSRTLLGAVLFVVGFSLVFICYGAIFGGLGDALRVHAVVLQRILGGLTIVLGLAFTGLFGAIPLFNRELRIHKLPAAGLLGAPALGVLFGLGWAPCIGPTLSTVLTLAASDSAATAGRGALLTAFYCAGLGLPFILVALAFRRTLGLLAVFRRHARAVMLVGGLLLATIGVLEVTGTWRSMVLSLQEHSAGFTPGL